MTPTRSGLQTVLDIMNAGCPLVFLDLRTRPTDVALEPARDGVGKHKVKRMTPNEVNAKRTEILEKVKTAFLAHCDDLRATGCSEIYDTSTIGEAISFFRAACTRCNLLAFGLPCGVLN